jgi:hypothetical protein
MSQPREVFILRNGPESLFQHETGSFRVLHEIEVDGQHYAIMRKHDDPFSDAYLYRFEQEQAIEVEDEQEWEQIVDIFDEQLHSYEH